MASGKRVTIKQVAREAGVSTQTVSRVINDRPDVSPQTRQRVLEVVRRLRYQPSALARSLIQQRTYSLGVVIAGLNEVGPSRTLAGMADRAERLGYTLLLKDLTDFHSREVEPILDSFMARQVDGIIWAVPEIGDNHECFQQQYFVPAIPFAFTTTQKRNGWHVVSIDNYLGGQIATRHLVANGYRRIGHVAGPQDWWEARQRKQAWADSLAESGLEPQPLHWVEGDWSPASGEAAIVRLLAQFPEMEAVFVANDQMALSVLHAAHERGIQVPHDLAVVGFDGLPETAYYWPPLTTVDQDQHELGCIAVEQLVGVIEAWREKREVARSEPTLLAPRLIVRGSSG